MKESCPAKKGSPFQPSHLYRRDVYMRKKLPTALAHALIVCLDRIDPARRARVLAQRKVGPAWRVTIPSKKGDPATRRDPTFCFSCKRFTTFCKELYEQLAYPGQLSQWSDPGTLHFSILTGPNYTFLGNCPPTPLLNQY